MNTKTSPIKEVTCHCWQKVATVKRCTIDDPHITIRKLANLMRHPMSAQSYERHLIVLNEFIESCTYAFWIMDLPYIMEVLEILVKEQNCVCLYKEPLLQLLMLCDKKPIMRKASDVIEFKRDLQEYFSFLGYLLIKIQKMALKNVVASALRTLLDPNIPVPKNCVPLKTCYNTIESSQLPKLMSQLLEIADEDLYIKILELTWHMVNISPTVCRTMINEKAIDYLIIRMRSTWRENSSTCASDDLAPYQNCNLTCKILWTLLDSFKHKINFEEKYYGPSFEVLKSIRFVFQTFTKTKNYELIRNHLLGIILQCLHLYPKLEIFSSGLGHDIAVLSVATEIGTKGTWASEITFNSTEVNYQFKKMLLLAVCYCTKSVETLKSLHPKRIIPGLLKLITPEISNIWYPEQHTKLISLTTYTLQTLIPAMPDDFLDCNGPLRLLMMVDYFMLESYDINTLKDCLKTLYCISSLNNNMINNLQNYDAYLILLNLCDTLLSNEILSLVIQECLVYAFSILECLCIRFNSCSSHSVDLCIKFMDRIIKPKTEDPLIDPKFIICGIDFLREGIVWNNCNLQSFTKIGGVFKLLDIIQQGIFPIKLISLSTLVDMCNIGLCLPHLLTWRNNGQQVLSMLLEIFREENLKLHVPTSLHGAISDIEFPIMGQQQRYETFYTDKDPNASPATVDMLVSCRPKIYAIVHLINNRHEQRANLIKEHFLIHNTHNLSTQNRITLLLVENFLSLKLGEVWVELDRDLQDSGIRPLAVDSELIGILIKRFRKWTQHIKIAQERLLDQELINECKVEMDVYNKLRDSKLQESLKALHDLRFIAKTTEHMFRLIDKMKQNKEINESLIFTEGVDHHHTYMCNLKVTSVFNQKASIQSNVILPLSDERFYIRPVSPCNDDENEIIEDDSNIGKSNNMFEY